MRELFDIPLYAVFAFVNDLDKKIYLTYSQETIIAIARNTKSIKEGSHSCRQLVLDIEKLDIRIIESITHTKNLKPRLLYWQDHYRKNGYSLYREYKAISYKVKVLITGIDTVGVYLVNKRKDKTLVGLFATVDQANTWSRDTYSDVVYDVVYHESISNKKK